MSSTTILLADHADIHAGRIHADNPFLTIKGKRNESVILSVRKRLEILAAAIAEIERKTLKALELGLKAKPLQISLCPTITVFNHARTFDDHRGFKASCTGYCTIEFQPFRTLRIKVAAVKCRDKVACRITELKLPDIPVSNQLCKQRSIFSHLKIKRMNLAASTISHMREIAVCQHASSDSIIPDTANIMLEVLIAFNRCLVMIDPGDILCDLQQFPHLIRHDRVVHNINLLVRQNCVHRKRLFIAHLDEINSLIIRRNASTVVNPETGAFSVCIIMIKAFHWSSSIGSYVIVISAICLHSSLQQAL